MIILISLLTVIITMLGGLFALRYNDKLHLILGFSAGTIIGAALFDLLPEAIELSSEHFSTNTVTTLVAIGFAVFLVLDRFFQLHARNDETGQNDNHRGNFGAGALSVHSFLDGMGIGLAFKVSPALGLVVTVAVLAHKFSDGLNTVNVILKNKGSRQMALRWLVTNALAPVLGITSTLFFSLPEHILGLVLAMFGGFFLYIGASDILPESHHRHPTIWTTLLTIAGMASLYAIIRLAGS